MSNFVATDKTALKRLPNRGIFDRAEIYRILDEAFICHVGFIIEGQPFVIPTGFARVDDRLYIHGSAASRMLRWLAQGGDVCVTVTLLDGLVLARSSFHHSVNYRSVVALGKARIVDDPDEKSAALFAFSEHVIPGRWNEVREPNEQEMKATLVLCLPLEEVSAKVRTGPPIDDEEDYTLPVWAGVLPLKLQPGEPIRDDRCAPDTPVPQNVRNYSRTSNAER